MIDESNRNCNESMICPICSTIILEDEDKIECPDCKIIYHKDCWIENNGCATYGCVSAGCLKPEPLKINITEIETEDHDIECPYCHTKLASGCIVCWACNKEIPKRIKGKNTNIFIQDTQNAGSWLRFGARHNDLFVEMILSTLSIVLFCYTMKNDSIYNYYSLLMIILIIPLLLIFDTLIYIIFGNTFGKWCYGIKVINKTGTKLSLNEYIKRDWYVLFYGLGLLIPIVYIISMWTQYKSVKHNNTSLYDEKLGYKVISYEPLIWCKLLIGIILNVINVLYIILLNVYSILYIVLFFIMHKILYIIRYVFIKEKLCRTK